jgi:poly-gamma-glutamate capsule biosynthesis protein CapA/YwtB (metallophosphatase superfamily)
VVATGDVLLHERLWTTAKRDGDGGRWDFAPLMASVNPLVQKADLAIAHLETSLAKAGGPQLIADSNVDLVIGHHAHVVQPMQEIAGKWIAYGHGNLVAARREPSSTKAEALLTRFTFTRKRLEDRLRVRAAADDGRSAGPGSRRTA